LQQRCTDSTTIFSNIEEAKIKEEIQSTPVILIFFYIESFADIENYYPVLFEEWGKKDTSDSCQQESLQITILEVANRE